MQPEAPVYAHIADTADTDDDTDSTDDTNDSDDFVQQVVELTNARRAEVGSPPLKLQDNLQNAAMWMAQDMAQHDYIRHTDRQGRDIPGRLNAFQYTGWTGLAENIGAGRKTPADIVQGWMDSPHHRDNLLNPDYREIGIGYFFQADDRDNVSLSDDKQLANELAVGPYYHYWVQNFGRRQDVYPLVIASEAARTDSTEVKLYIYGKGWAEEMRLSNDGTTWTDWMPYQETRAWTLADGDNGSRTVFVELRQSDTTLQTHDSIILERAAAPPPPAEPTPEPLSRVDFFSAGLHPG
jgi:uncharacterized protein YkwD